MSDLQDQNPCPEPARPPRPPSPKRSFHTKEHETDKGTLMRFAPLLTGPKISPRIISVTVAFDEMDILATSVYNGLRETLFSGQPAPDDLVTQDQFLNVCKALLKSRVDYVTRKVTGIRPANAASLNTVIRVPRIIAEAINNYGTIPVAQLTSTFYPIMAVPAQGVAVPAFVLAETTAFQQFLNMVEQRGFSNTSNLSGDPIGTPAWILTALSANPGRNVPIPAPLAVAGTQGVFVRSQFSEFTPVDALFAALTVTNRTTFVFPGNREFPWYADEVADAPALRLRLATSY